MKYHVFLSYSHSADARLAPLLHRALERLGTPWWRRSPLRVFRDDASLPASSVLWSGIEAALSRSEYLVLLASPSSAASFWIDREIRWWLTNRQPDRLLIAVTAGEVAYDNDIADFDFTRSSCLPAAFKGIFNREPHWVDLRPANQAERLSLRDTRLRSPALALAAAVRGVSKDALENSDLRQHRRAWISVMGVVAALLMAGGVALVAMNTARTESDAARLARLQAESRRLAAEALSQVDRGELGGMAIEAATLKAALAWRLAPTQEARQALRRIDQATPGVVRVLGQHTSQIDKLAFSADAQTLWSADISGNVLAWRLDSGKPAGAAFSAGKMWPQQLLRSREGGHLLVTGNADTTHKPLVGLFTLPQGAEVPLGEDWRSALAGLRPGIELDCAALSANGNRVALGFGGDLLVIDTANGRTTTHRLPGQTQVAALGFATESRLAILMSDPSGGIGAVRAAALDLQSGRISSGPSQRGSANRCARSAFSPDASRVGVMETTDSRLTFWEITETLALKRLKAPRPPPALRETTSAHAPAFDAGGRRVAWGERRLNRVWDFETDQPLTNQSDASGYGSHTVLSDDGRLAAAIVGGAPIVWQVDGAGSSHRLAPPRCGSGALEDACIQRLCERLTAAPDTARWRALLGESYALIAAALPDTQCAATGTYTKLPTR